ncbi:major facilitator superfamily domain-containing protein [Gautieria morchelliformis]|nr:major facilitator superfamily domain-containing protein [Gautieria morchelliformis]
MQSRDSSNPRRDFRFWLIILSIALSLFIAALELVGVSTALPVIVADLHGSQFVWVFGRRPVMLCSLFIFASGSAVCGAAPSLGVLIVGRTIQGLGGGGILSLTQIILSDLVPLRERGMFNGLVGIAWAVASGVGPVIGGSLAESGQWRWLFYLNIPVCGIAGVLVFNFLRLRTPTGTLKEKMAQMDWIGNMLVIASSSACMVALTWGGVQFSWSSTRVLVPLILGLLGLAGFVAYDAKIATHPIVPFSILSTATSISGYMQTFFMPIALIALIYYMPVYFQACKTASPIASGVDVFGLAFSIAPAGIISGLSVAKSHQYRPQLWLAWTMIMIGAGLLSTITADSSRMTAIGYEIIVGAGMGILTMTTYFPVLAPLPVSPNAKALAFFTFCRNFAQVWGVTIGGSVLQNELKHRLPSDFVSVFPEGTAIAYAVIPLISTMEQPLKDEVRKAFAGSLSVIWRVLIGVGALGLIASLGMKRLPLHTGVDRDWGIAVSDRREEPKA